MIVQARSVAQNRPAHSHNCRSPLMLPIATRDNLCQNVKASIACAPPRKVKWATLLQQIRLFLGSWPHPPLVCWIVISDGSGRSGPAYNTLAFRDAGPPCFVRQRGAAARWCSFSQDLEGDAAACGCWNSPRNRSVCTAFIALREVWIFTFLSEIQGGSYYSGSVFKRRIPGIGGSPAS